MGDYYNGDHSLASMEQYRWYQIRTNADGNVIEAKEASVLNTQTGARYVKDLDKINDKVEESGVNTVLYLTAGGPYKANGDFDNTTGYTGKMEVKGNNTLAITDAEGSGIWFKDDVNVVLQYWNRNKQEKDVMQGEGVSALKEMVDIVNGEIGNRGSNSYYVSALIENGRATTIVIYDSYNNYKRPGSDDKITGNIVLADSSKGMMLPVDGKTTLGTAEVLGSGSTTVKLAFKAPEWASADAANEVTYDVVMKVNGKAWARAYQSTNNSGDSALALSSNVFTHDLSGTFNLKTYVQNGVIDPNKDTITVEISNVAWKYAKVEYKYAGGNTAIDAANIKAADGSADAATEMLVGKDNATGFGFMFKKAADQTVSDTAKYSISGAQPGKDETTKLSDKLTDSTAVSFSADTNKGIYAIGGQKVVVTISGVSKTAAAGPFTVDSVSTKPVKFAVVDGTLASVTSVPANAEWKDSVEANEGDTVLVKSATDGVKLKGVTAHNPNAANDAITINTETSAGSGVYKFSMPAKDVRVSAVTTSEIEVVKYFFNGDTDVLNILVSDDADLDTVAAKYDFAISYFNSLNLGKTATAKTNANGTTTGVLINGAEVTTNVAEDLKWATVNKKTVVSSNSTDVNLDDFLSLAGVASVANYFVKMTDATDSSTKAVAFDSNSQALDNGDEIDTNDGKGWIKTDGTTAITATADVTGATNTLTSTNVGTLQLTVTVAADDQFKDTNIYVKVGATGTINVKTAADKTEYTVADKNIKALIGVTGGTVDGTYATATAVPELAIGQKIDNTTGVDLTFTFKTEAADTGVSALKVTFTEA